MRAFLIAIVCTGLAVCAGCQTKTAPDDGETQATSDVGRPKPPSAPPYPKAAIPMDKRIHNFGAMMSGTEGKHEFKIRNDGDYPLQLVQGKSSCACTVSGLSDDKLQKGDTATITLKWTPKQFGGKFRQTVAIYTNDPDPANATITLVVEGEIVTLLSIHPEGGWITGPIAGGKSKTIHGMVFSRVRDKFEISNIGFDDKELDVKKTAMSKEELATHKAKSGFKISVTVKSKQSVGSFEEILNFKTDLKGVPEVPILVAGSRTGPILLRPDAGTTWSTDAMRMFLKQFPVSDGASGSLVLYVSGLGENEELKVTDMKADPSFLQVKLVPVNRSQPVSKAPGGAQPVRKKAYRLSVTVPRDIEPTTRMGRNAAIVTLMLSHKQIHSFRFAVEFDAF